MKHLQTLLFLGLILILALAACGGEETPPAPTETEAPAATEEDVPAPEPTLEPEPAATAVPEPTAEPNEEPTEEPTAEPAAPEVAVDGWGASNSGPQSACDHPYWPMREGARWVFRSAEGGDLTWEIIEVNGDLQNAEATMQMTTGGAENALTFNYTWECSADGGLVSFDFAGQNFEQAGLEMDMQVTAGTGEFLPAPELLQAGYSWDTTLDSTFSFMMAEGDVEMTIGGSMTNETTNTVTSTEPVSFEGATVDGLQIEQASDMTMTMDMLGTSTTTDLNLGNTMVLGRGIGMISQTNRTEFGDVTTELVEVNIP
jgi:hypothetical protein